MSPEEVEKLINKICWGGRHIRVTDYLGKSTILILKTLTAREKQFVDFIYHQALEEATSLGVVTRFELSNKLKIKNVWTNIEDQKIDEIIGQIDNARSASKNYKKNSREYKRFERQFSDLEEQLSKLRSEKNTYFHSTAESYADEMRSLALVYCSSYLEDEIRKWTSWDDFLENADDVLIKNIIQEINKTSVISIKELRFVARSPQWRFRWNGAKSVGNLFGKPISEFDSEQQGLLYWSQVYDSVYEAHERPSDDIINNDDALDDWFESQDKKNKVKKMTETNNKTTKGLNLSRNISRHGEIFIVANNNINPDAPDVSEVDSLNTQFVREFKQKELERIKQNGLINEKELRDRKNKIARKIIGSNDSVIKSNSFGQSKGGKAGNIMPGGTIS